MSSTQPEIAAKNPFPDAHSSYATFDGTVLQMGEKMPSAFHIDAHSTLRKIILAKSFACVAGQTALKTNKYAFCAYSDMTSEETAEGLCHDLIKFKTEFGIPELKKSGAVSFMSFIATFEHPEITDQLHGVACLYQLLHNMHLLDKKYGIPWSPASSPDIHSNDFSYSNGGDSFFIPLLYPYASSESRRTPIPYLVFNAHTIFENLRKKGGFAKLKEVIRSRQAHVHPNLGDFGQVTEWDQYGLVDVDKQPAAQAIMGKCPFHKK